MKAINKIFIIIVCLIFSFVLSFAHLKADEKKYVDVSIEQEFSTNSVCLLITHSASMQVKDYTPRDFIEVSPDQVIDDDPYTYEYIVKYLKGEQIDTNKINIDQFRRGLTLKWNNDKTKEEIIEIIHILEQREDIYLVQPNYYYTFDNGGLQANYDVVDKNIWHNYYYISVTNKFDETYYINGKWEYVVEAKLIKSYNELVGLENNIDVLIQNILSNNTFKFNVSKEEFDLLHIGYEYIIRLPEIKNVHNEMADTFEQMPKTPDNIDEAGLVRVIRNRIYLIDFQIQKEFKDGVQINKRQMTTNKMFTGQLNKYIFKKTFVKNDLPFEFELKYEYDPAGSIIKVYISNEEKEKMDPNQFYVYYYYKCGTFLQTGDSVLMFDEYIKIAEEIYNGKSLFEPEDVSSLRIKAINNIINQ